MFLVMQDINCAHSTKAKQQLQGSNIFLCLFFLDKWNASQHHYPDYLLFSSSLFNYIRPLIIVNAFLQ